MTKSLRLLISICFSTLFNLNSTAQEIVIRGTVSNQAGLPLSDVTIVTQNKRYTISNENGSFVLRIPDRKPKATLSISRLGCIPIDTSISLSEKFVSIEITLQEKVYEIGSVTVNSDYFNILEEPNRIVKDFTIVDNQFIFLYKEKADQKLGLFSLQGDLIHEQIIPSYYKFKQIVISCTGTVLVVGRQECMEYFLSNVQLTLLNSFSKKKYEQLLLPCIAKLGNTLYFKRYKEHNKIVDYSVNTNDQDLRSIISITDSNALKIAQEYYHDVLIAYTDAIRDNYTLPNQRRNLSDYVRGDNMTNQHLINDSLWDGNMLKLMVDERTDEMVRQYVQLESLPILTEEFIKDSLLYIVNHIDKNLLRFNPKTNLSKELPLEGMSWKEKYKPIHDKGTNLIYLINPSASAIGNITIDLISINELGGKLKNITSLPIIRDKKGTVLIHHDILYYVTHGGSFRSIKLG